VPWAKRFFSGLFRCVTDVLRTKVRDQQQSRQLTNLITKVFFPRLVIPYTPLLASLTDFAIGFVMKVLVVVGFGLVPNFSPFIYPVSVFPEPFRELDPESNRGCDRRVSIGDAQYESAGLGDDRDLGLGERRPHRQRITSLPAIGTRIRRSGMSGCE